MTGSAGNVALPKKRTLFKRAAWQDAPNKEGDDIFSHSNEFNDIVAEQARRRAEEKRKEDATRKRKNSEPYEKKRRRISAEEEEPALSKTGSSSKAQGSRTGSSTPSHPPSDSLTTRYDSLTKSASSNASLSRQKSVIFDLASSDEDENKDKEKDKYDPTRSSKPFNDNAQPDHKPFNAENVQSISVRTSKPPPVNIDHDDDDDDEELNPVLAALNAIARERVAAKARAAAARTPDQEPVKAPIAQIFIEPQMDGANAMVIKLRIDSTIEKPRLAWCAKQNFSPEMTRNVFFTWKDTRLYDSTVIQRLGILVDSNGNVTVDGDSNIYDDVNVPKIHVEAWTEHLFKQHKEADAEKAAAKRMAAEAVLVVEERTPSPEPPPTVPRIKLTLAAKGREEFGLSVKPDTTFAHVASAYKEKFNIEKSQPITLMFDGDRLSPLDTIEAQAMQDMDTIDVLFK
ncbi:hypothetical protein BDW02DRAFT_123398 [Decorospora gaudefroyi]|uniref:Rad60/SUMO-like domain-containing protein n=1 Tax=Decorospora gaudefroyi TaxID=184978 RepID=A0A6A5K029_9PLEO|nr:hypothetical protein BDW02DRAFT_123398 [Decorospora gaudefroyi]